MFMQFIYAVSIDVAFCFFVQSLLFFVRFDVMLSLYW